MNKQYLIAIALLFIGIASYAQEKPGWIYNKPKPENNTYAYNVEWGVGATVREAENEALSKMFRYAANRIGQPFDAVDINNALQSGMDYSVISSQYNIPINKVCEYPEKNGGEWTVYLLCQVASAGNISVIWGEFTRCDRQGVDGMAVLKSALVPGLGQFHKGQTGKGVGFLVGEAISIGGIVAGQSMRHTYINKMNSTHNATEKKFYADRANTFTTVRNIGIGAAVAVYVWNVLDAIVAKGSNRSSLSYGSPVIIMPVVTDESVAMSVNLNF